MTTTVHLPPILATVIFLIGIAGLFWLDRDREAQTTKALWIPTAWLLITCSRPVSMWLGVSPNAGTADIYVEGSPVDAAVFITLVTMALAVVIARRDRVEPILRENWPILLFFLFAGFSILWSDFPFVTFKHWVKGVGDVLMVLILLTEPSVTDATKRLVTRVGFTLLPLSMLLCKYYLDLGRRLNLSWVMEWTGVATQKNSLGGLCLVFGLGLLWRFRIAYKDSEDPNRRRRLLALGTVLAMAIWLLLKSNSMTSLCALTMAGTVMVLSGRPAFRRRPGLVHLLIVVMVGTALYAIFFQSSGELLHGLGRDPTLTGRTNIWQAVLSVPVNPVVGAGYESFWMGQRLQYLWTRFPNLLISEAHNGYIEVYLNLGWIGISLLAGIMVFGYRVASLAFRRGSEMGALCLAWLLAAAIRGQTEAAFRMMSSSWIFFLLAIMAASRATVASEAYQAADKGDFAEDEPAAEFALGSQLDHWYPEDADAEQYQAY